MTSLASALFPYLKSALVRIDNIPILGESAIINFLLSKTLLRMYNLICIDLGTK